MSVWTEAKKKRYKETGGQCEVCQGWFRLSRMVGHHKISRKKGGTYTYENLELRCVADETWAHRVSPDGNPTEKQIAERLLTEHRTSFNVRGRK